MTSFDTLRAAKSLQDAGFETQQAEAVVGMVTYALSEGLATKDDVRELRSGLGALENKVAVLDGKIEALDSKIEALDSKFETQFAALDSKFEAQFAALDSKFETQFAALDNKFETQFAALDVKIGAGLKNVTQKLTIYLGGIVVGAITLLEVLSRIFPVVPAP